MPNRHDRRAKNDPWAGGGMNKPPSDRTVATLGNVLKTQLHGLSVVDADEVICLARRILWHTALAGKPLIADAGKQAEKAMVIADFFDGMSLWDIAQVFERHRMMMWATQYPQAAHAAFQTRNNRKDG